MGKRVETVVNPQGADMGKFGHVELSITMEELRQNFHFGDVLKVTIEGIGSFVMPFFPYYDEVGVGELVLCTYTKHSTGVIARNYRSFGQEIGLLEADAQGGNFRMADGYKVPVRVTLELEESGGTKGRFSANSLGKREKDRYDFRGIGGNTIRPGMVFRSSSPIDGRLADSEAADARAREAGIRSVLNLADTREEAESFRNFHQTYCSRCKTAYLNMPLNVLSPGFQKAIQTGLKAIAEWDPPFLIFCSEGRDRTGLFVALLQCLCGVELTEIVADYLDSFRLICPHGENQDVLCNAEKSLLENLHSILGVRNAKSNLLCAEAEKYMGSIGVKEETIRDIRRKIGEKHETTEG